MVFKDGIIEGVFLKELKKFTDERGWLSELFRHDELNEGLFPAMSYTSMTHPGITRGPHTHTEQTDYFVFMGPSDFKVFLWDDRKNSPTYLNKMIILAGEKKPLAMIVPPGVVHAYKNIGSAAGIVMNFPNRLFKGRGKKEPADEIRYEDDPDCIFKVDE